MMFDMNNLVRSDGLKEDGAMTLQIPKTDVFDDRVYVSTKAMRLICPLAPR
jgi:hypothetical protein